MKRIINDIKNKSFKISETEKTILEILRNKDFQKVSVIVKKGLPIRLEVEEEMHEISDGKMNRIIKEKDYQTVNLIKRNGVISLIRRKETIPLNN